MGPFDAVALWCIGAYGLRIGPTAEDKRQYRVNVRGLTFQMAAELLRPGGALQIVDRLGVMQNYSDHRKAVNEMYLQIAKDLPLDWQSMAIREVDALTAPGGIPMKSDPSVRATERFALQSVILVRR